MPCTSLRISSASGRPTTTTSAGQNHGWSMMMLIAVLIHALAGLPTSSRQTVSVPVAPVMVPASVNG